MPEELESQLDEEARREGVGRSEVARTAIAVEDTPPPAEAISMRRGEAWTANLDPSRGQEIGRIRPVLIVQADELIDAGTPMVVVLPLTTQVYPGFKRWRMGIPARDRLREPCQVVVDQPRAIDRARLADGPFTRLTRPELEAVERSLRRARDVLTALKAPLHDSQRTPALGSATSPR